MTPIEKAISCLGSPTKLAEKLDCSPQVINNWMARGRVPAERCPAIERATAGQVSCEDLRPDVDWGYLRNTAKREGA